MPLYSYECQKCNEVFELFQHNSSRIEVQCVNCNHNECKRLMGRVSNRTRYNARDNLNKRIEPEVNRIMSKVSQGSDKDFLDIAGE